MCCSSTACAGVSLCLHSAKDAWCWFLCCSGSWWRWQHWWWCWCHWWRWWWWPWQPGKGPVNETNGSFHLATGSTLLPCHLLTLNQKKFLYWFRERSCVFSTHSFLSYTMELPTLCVMHTDVSATNPPSVMCAGAQAPATASPVWILPDAPWAAALPTRQPPPPEPQRWRAVQHRLRTCSSSSSSRGKWWFGW